MDFTGFRDIVRQAQAGDPQARGRLQEVLAPYVGKLVRQGSNIADPMESVRDRINDVWLRFFQKLPQFRGAEETSDDTQTGRVFCAWLRLLANSVLRNSQRDRARHHPRYTVPLPPAESDGSTNRGPALQVAGKDERPSQLAVAAEMQQTGLSPIQREMVRLRLPSGTSSAAWGVWS